MSPDLIAFLKAWHEWATNGALDGKPFDRSCGLCTNALDFGEHEDDGAYFDLKAILYAEFGDDAADTPFGSVDYSSRAISNTQHECPKRLAWVRAKLAEAGELVA